MRKYHYIGWESGTGGGFRRDEGYGYDYGMISDKGYVGDVVKARLGFG